MDWEFDLVPKRKEKRSSPKLSTPAHHKHKESRYTYPSERNYKPMKNHRHYHNHSDDEDESNDGHNHHHTSKRHHETKHKKKHHSHSDDSKSEEKHHHHHEKHHDSHEHHHKKEKHHHHHNEIDPEFVQYNQEMPQYHTFNLDLKEPTLPSIVSPRVPLKPAVPEHPIYHDGGFENVKNEMLDDHMRYAAEHFGLQLLNLDEFESDENGAKKGKKKKSKKSKEKKADIPEKIKEKVIKRQQETKAPWTASHAHLSTPIAPVDTHWRESPKLTHMYEE